MKIELTKLNERGGKRFLVLIDGIEAGTISKYDNTRTETHPWKAWVFTGKLDMPSQPAGWVYEDMFLGSFYGSGGRADAINALSNSFSLLHHEKTEREIAAEGELPLPTTNL